MNSPLNGKVAPFGQSVDLFHRYLNDPEGEVLTDAGPMPNLRRLARNIGFAITDKVDQDIIEFREMAAEVAQRAQATAEALAIALASNDVINVRQFGVTGDGTDQSAQEQLAADAAVAAKKPLYFPRAPVGYYAGPLGHDFRRDGLVIRGEGMPEYTDAWGRMQGGTIFLGTVDMEGSQTGIVDVGIDCGEWYRTTILQQPTIWHEGLRNTSAGDPDALNTYNRSFAFDRVRVNLAPALADDPRSWAHGLLMERIIGIEHGFIEIHGGFHGYVAKALQVVGGNVVVHGQLGTTWIIKSDVNSSYAGDVHLNSISVGHPEFNEFTQGVGVVESLGKNTRNVTVSTLTGRKCNTLLKRSGNLEVVGVNVGHIDFSDGNQYVPVVDLDSGCRSFKLATHRIRDCMTGIRTTGGTDIDVGSGSVANARDDGYVFEGDVSHGNLRPIDCGLWGVRNNGCFNIDPSRVFASDCGLGAVSSLANFMNRAVLVPPWTSESARATLVGGTLQFTGVIKALGSAPTGNLVFILGDELKPAEVVRGIVLAWTTVSNEWKNLTFELYPSGDLLVYGASALGSGGWIELKAISYMVGVGV